MRRYFHLINIEVHAVKWNDGYGAHILNVVIK